MGGNNNQNQGASGNDPKGVGQNQSAHQQTRFENQQGPMVQSFAQNYGQGSEQNLGDYTDIMNMYGGIANDPSAGMGGFASGAYGGPGYSAFTVTPGSASYTDPFASYSKFQDLSKTGGYSDQDMSDLRSRGTAPVRAAYANAEREVNRGRSLQGGYSPNAAAAQAKMAREQSQASADAMQNVNAGIIGARNQGQLAGMQGMAGIEGQRLGADVDVSKYNTGLGYQGQTFNAEQQARAQAGNIGIGQSNAAANASAANQSNQLASQRQMGALAGMTNLYGTTPGLSSTFGNQLLQGVGLGGSFGNQLYANDIQNQRAPGAFDQTMGRINQIGGMASGAGNAIQNYFQNRGNGGQQTYPYSPSGPTWGSDYGPQQQDFGYYGPTE
jgi:hypothetical protein